MSEQISESGPAFEVMMHQIDAGFAQDKVPMHARPIKAVIAVGRRYKISLPLVVPLPTGTPTELHRYAPLVRNIHDWYDRLYGDRIKLDFSLGSMVIDIGDDLYVMRFPRVFGNVCFVISRQFTERPRAFSRGPVLCNVVQLIQNLTPAKADTLTDEALRTIWEAFFLGLGAMDILEGNQHQELIRIARGDVQAAVNNLMDRVNRFGESKWASLQVAEKTLKAAIAIEGATFKYSHRLSDLCGQLDSLGIKFDWQPVIDQIQCNPGIRYGEETCTREEALRAHHASLKLTAMLADAGAKFRRQRLQAP